LGIQKVPKSNEKTSKGCVEGANGVTRRYQRVTRRYIKGQLEGTKGIIRWEQRYS
jgi:hypothetical protein